MLLLTDKVTFKATKSIRNLIDTSEKFKNEVIESIHALSNEYWNGLPDAVKHGNTELFEPSNYNLLSSYNTSEGTIYVDLNCTNYVCTIMLPEEYTQGVNNG